MTRAAIEAAKNADYRRYEAYTALWGQDALEGLENEIGEIQKVMRPEVEAVSYTHLTLPTTPYV